MVVIPFDSSPVVNLLISYGLQTAPSSVRRSGAIQGRAWFREVIALNNLGQNYWFLSPGQLLQLAAAPR